jgi:hypothetical protein
MPIRTNEPLVFELAQPLDWEPLPHIRFRTNLANVVAITHHSSSGAESVRHILRKVETQIQLPGKPDRWVVYPSVLHVQNADDTPLHTVFFIVDFDGSPDIRQTPHGALDHDLYLQASHAGILCDTRTKVACG